MKKFILANDREDFVFPNMLHEITSCSPSILDKSTIKKRIKIQKNEIILV